MPVVHHWRDLPSWSELDTYSVIDIPPRGELAWAGSHPGNKLVVVDGRVLARVAGADHALESGAVLDAPAGRHRLGAPDGARVVLLGGHWGEECGGSGVFTAAEVATPIDRGDPTDYPKRTSFDRHFHDCDEYWIVVGGHGTAVTEGRHFDIAPGDCVATRMGVHHDLPLASEPVRGVYFETTLRGQRRLGHLWEHTHGPAIPADEEAETVQ